MTYYGCIKCLTPRPAEMMWDWITLHRMEGCPEAIWGTWQDDDETEP